MKKETKKVRRCAGRPPHRAQRGARAPRSARRGRARGIRVPTALHPPVTAAQGAGAAAVVGSGRGHAHAARARALARQAVRLFPPVRDEPEIFEHCREARGGGRGGGRRAPPPPPPPRVRRATHPSPCLSRCRTRAPTPRHRPPWWRPRVAVACVPCRAVRAEWGPAAVRARFRARPRPIGNAGEQLRKSPRAKSPRPRREANARRWKTHRIRKRRNPPRALDRRRLARAARARHRRRFRFGFVPARVKKKKKAGEASIDAL